MTFGERLRRRRRELDVTQAQLAAVLGHTQPCLSQWESGRTEPSLANLRALAEALQISIDWLVLGTPSGIIISHTEIAPGIAVNDPGAGTEGDASMQGQGYIDPGEAA
jgi:transcriptional regulator with XRE-family HTH domain